MVALQRTCQAPLATLVQGPPPPHHDHLHAARARPAGAPEWAVAQREGLERLTDIIEWWGDNQQQENGEFGGAWSDDHEMWRWWVPVLIGFDSPRISGPWERSSTCLPQAAIG